MAAGLGASAGLIAVSFENLTQGVQFRAHSDKKPEILTLSP
jgi:hypothetical protein